MRLINAIIIWTFNAPNKKNNGRIPLDFTPKALVLSVFLSIVMGCVVGNLFIKGLEYLSVNSLTEGIKKNLSSKAETTAAKLEIIVKDYPNNYSVISQEGRVALDNLLLDQEVHLDQAVAYIESTIKKRTGLTVTSDQIIEDIHGEVKGFPYLVFKKKNLLVLMEEYGYSKPMSVKKLTETEMEYFIIANLISTFREEHKNKGGVNFPHWLLTAFADYLQWIIFLTALTCFFLLLLKLRWVKINRFLIENGRMPNDTAKGNLWEIDQTSPEHLPLFNQLTKKMPKILMPVNLIEATLKNAGKEENFEKFLSFEVEKLRIASEDSHKFINTLYESCPSLGFIGTIIGATLAFSHASIILKETEPFFQGVAMGVLTNDLSISFFTTLVGLLAAIVLSFFIAKTSKAEIELFTLLEATGKKKLKKYWK